MVRDTLYIANLHEETNADDLLGVLEPFGEVAERVEVAAEERRDAALRDRQRHALQRLEPAVEHLPRVADLHHRHTSPPALRRNLDAGGRNATRRRRGPAAARGWLDYEACLLESLVACKRAGADLIFTYGALDAARLVERRRSPRSLRIGSAKLEIVEPGC